MRWQAPIVALSLFALPLVALVALPLVAACGPSGASNSDCPEVDLETDSQNCGACDNVCAAGQACRGGECTTECAPRATEACYDGVAATRDVGPCHSGMRTCQASGYWGLCLGEVLPDQEVCGNGVDEDCSGTADQDADADGDGFTTCAGDCCDSTECTRPELVNPGAFDAAGNNLDDDCDGQIDNTVVACDTGLSSNSADGLDYARAMELCQVVTEQSRQWGVISATLTLANGQGVPDPDSHSIRPNYGPGLPPQQGAAFTLLASGTAAAVGQTNPAFVDLTQSSDFGTESPFPADWLAANGNSLPNAPGCPEVLGNAAEDPVMLTLRLRAPSNAKSFSFGSNFYSAEFPEYVCSPYNDFFVVLLDSTWAGTPANPSDKNLAFYRQASTMQIYPVGVNLGFGNTGLFTQCRNGGTGCAFASTPGTISTCTGVGQLQGTGLDTPQGGSCDADSLAGGATGWLQTSGNVVGGEIITLRIAIWDTSDHVLDSLVVLDNFAWSVDVSDPGTIPQ
jgi:hypothetical protein